MLASEQDQSYRRLQLQSLTDTCSLYFKLYNDVYSCCYNIICCYPAEWQLSFNKLFEISTEYDQKKLQLSDVHFVLWKFSFLKCFWFADFIEQNQSADEIIDIKLPADVIM